MSFLHLVHKALLFFYLNKTFRQFCPLVLPFQGSLTALEVLKAFSFYLTSLVLRHQVEALSPSPLPLQSERWACSLWVAPLLWRGWELIFCFYPELHHRKLDLFYCNPSSFSTFRGPQVSTLLQMPTKILLNLLIRWKAHHHLTVKENVYD